MAPAQSPNSAPQFTGISDHHACYFSHELTRRAAQGIDQLSASLFDAAVDLNPHQIEAALYFFRSPTVKGVLLADEVVLIYKNVDNEHGDKTLCQSCLEYVTDDYWHDSAKERGI